MQLDAVEIVRRLLHVTRMVAATFASATATGRKPCMFGVSFHVVITWPMWVCAGLARRRGASHRRLAGNRLTPSANAAITAAPIAEQ